MPKGRKSLKQAAAEAIKTEDQRTAERRAEGRPPELKVDVLSVKVGQGNTDILEKLRDVAYWERRTLSSLVVEWLRDGAARYERNSEVPGIKPKNKPYPPREQDLATGRPRR